MCRSNGIKDLFGRHNDEDWRLFYNGCLLLLLEQKDIRAHLNIGFYNCGDVLACLSYGGSHLSS